MLYNEYLWCLRCYIVCIVILVPKQTFVFKEVKTLHLTLHLLFLTLHLYHYSFDHHYNASNETHTWLEVKQYGAGVSPTDLRYDPTYIVVMHWLRTMFDGILPFVTLLFLNGKIFIGLKKVKLKIELHAKANSNTKDANGNRTHDQQSESNRGW